VRMSSELVDRHSQFIGILTTETRRNGETTKKDGPFRGIKTAQNTAQSARPYGQLHAHCPGAVQMISTEATDRIIDRHVQWPCIGCAACTCISAVGRSLGPHRSVSVRMGVFGVVMCRHSVNRWLPGSLRLR
jgi:hypothetical protein